MYNEESEECDVKSQHGLYSLMLRVMDDASEQAMATGHVSKYDMNLDSYRTRHDSMFFVRTATTVYGGYYGGEQGKANFYA